MVRCLNFDPELESDRFDKDFAVAEQRLRQQQFEKKQD